MQKESNLNLWIFISVIVITFFNIIYLGNFRIGYPIFGFMTQLGKFDDFFNNFHFGRILPNPNESYMMMPLFNCIF